MAASQFLPDAPPFLCQRGTQWEYLCNEKRSNFLPRLTETKPAGAPRFGLFTRHNPAQFYKHKNSDTRQTMYMHSTNTKTSRTPTQTTTVEQKGDSDTADSFVDRTATAATEAATAPPVRIQTDSRVRGRPPPHPPLNIRRNIKACSLLPNSPPPVRPRNGKQVHQPPRPHLPLGRPPHPRPPPPRSTPTAPAPPPVQK